MEIKNVTQFSNFINANGLLHLDSIFVQILDCLTKYTASCNCHKVEDKMKLYNNCNKLYITAVNTTIPKLKNIILSKVTGGRMIFRIDNGTIISILNR